MRFLAQYLRQYSRNAVLTWLGNERHLDKKCVLAVDWMTPAQIVVLGYKPLWWWLFWFMCLHHSFELLSGHILSALISIWKFCVYLPAPHSLSLWSHSFICHLAQSWHSVSTKSKQGWKNERRKEKHTIGGKEYV